LYLNCNGIKGDPGPQGIQGECGEQGIVGKDGKDGESFPKQGEAWLVDGMDTTKADYHFEDSIFVIVKKVDNEKFVVIINWLPNTEPDLAGYKIYYGRESGKYYFCIDIGMTERYEIEMPDLGEWFFAITAYDESRNESGYSNEEKLKLT